MDFTATSLFFRLSPSSEPAFVVSVLRVASRREANVQERACSWKQILLDDDGQAEKMLMGDPSVGAGPDGFGHGTVEVMNRIACQVKQLGAENSYCVTLVLRNPLYLAPPTAKDPKAGAPADAAGAVGTRLSTSHVPYFKDPVNGLRSTGGLVASLFRIIVHTTR
ncbi:hypothetical protein EDD85DRAFT_784017 [Armillaria nabsnona]|nr:hypothetical protein EDD85DRAFT_784017 [Armillaria nabsnona]